MGIAWDEVGSDANGDARIACSVRPWDSTVEVTILVDRFQASARTADGCASNLPSCLHEVS